MELERELTRLILQLGLKRFESIPLLAILAVHLLARLRPLRFVKYLQLRRLPDFGLSSTSTFSFFYASKAAIIASTGRNGGQEEFRGLDRGNGGRQVVFTMPAT